MKKWKHNDVYIMNNNKEKLLMKKDNFILVLHVKQIEGLNLYALTSFTYYTFYFHLCLYLVCDQVVYYLFLFNHHWVPLDLHFLRVHSDPRNGPYFL